MGLRTCFLALALAAVSLGSAQSLPSTDLVVTGKRMTPVGKHEYVGSYPIQMETSADGKFAFVSTIGFRQFISVVRVADGKVIQQLPFPRPGQGLYYGITRHGNTLFASRGAQNKVTAYEIGADGKLTQTFEMLDVPARGAPMQDIAGIAASEDGLRLYAVNNQTTVESNFQGAVTVFNIAQKQTEFKFKTSGFPLSIAAIHTGPFIDRKIYVSSERDGTVIAYDPVKGQHVASISTGAQPNSILLSKNNSRLYVANGGSDTISVIDTMTDRVMNTILLRPPGAHALPSAGPVGLALSPDQKSLYVALSDMNCIAVINLLTNKVQGYIPTGWLPTAIVASRDGKSLLVTCAKGTKTRNPNGVPVGEKGRYIQDIVDGSITHMPVPTAAQLKKHTSTVIENNFIDRVISSKAPMEGKKPGIKYVIYIVKENRTYDQVLSDIPRGVRDKSLLMFGKEVTPNQHALVERFVQLDNFYVCAEVSADGWNWSTAGMVSPYTSRNTVYNYSGRGRNYDFEGQNNGVPVDILGLPDVAKPAGGYIWDQALKNKVTFRNYGLFVTFNDPEDKRFTQVSKLDDQIPVKKALQNHTDNNFRRYDLAYADSDAWVKYDSPFPKQLLKNGKFDSPSRFSAWKREFDEFVKKGEMPRFQMIRFGNDHTAGTRAGWASPRAMVADNDYAVGSLVEAISKSKFWKETAIFILQDDAQAGYDHIDGHRSTAYVISPWVKRNTLDSRFYNTDSMLRTMGILLGMKPMNLYDAIARPMDVFGDSPANAEPFNAILPDKDIVCEQNKPNAFMAQRSAELFPRLIPDPGRDHEQTRILWTAVTGKPVPARYAGRVDSEEDED